MTATSAGRRRAANGCGCGCASASVGALRQRERSECRARVSIEMAQGASQRIPSRGNATAADRTERSRTNGAWLGRVGPFGGEDNLCASTIPDEAGGWFAPVGTGVRSGRGRRGGSRSSTCQEDGMLKMLSAKFTVQHHAGASTGARRTSQANHNERSGQKRGMSVKQLVWHQRCGS